MAVVSFITAPPGGGKTFSRVHYLVTEWLPHYPGDYWTNLPLNIDAIAEYFDKRHKRKKKGPTGDEVRKRIHLIPREELREWMLQAAVKERLSEDEAKEWAEKAPGPWRFFEDVDLEGALIDIDEIHNFVFRDSPKHWLAAWMAWLGELRHRGVANLCLISQAEMKVAKTIRDHATRHVSLVNAEDRRDPVFRIPMVDWYELFASISGEWRPCIFEVEKIQIHGKFREQVSRRFHLGEPFYRFYNSYAAPHKGGKAAQGPQHRYLALTRPQLVRWFVGRNWGRLFSRFVLAAVILYLFTHPKLVLDGFLGIFSNVGPSAHASEGGDHVTVAGAEGVPVTADGSPVDPVGELEAENQALKDQLAELRNLHQASSAVAAIAPGVVIMRSGRAFRVGERIVGGRYDGALIEWVDMRRRVVHLGNGEALWLIDAD